MTVVMITRPDVVCDFCSGKPVTTRYVAHSFISNYSTPGLTIESDGDWAACDHCASYIDSNQWHELILKVVDKFFQVYPEMKELVKRDDIYAEYQSMYKQFKECQIKKVPV